MIIETISNTVGGNKPLQQVIENFTITYRWDGFTFTSAMRAYEFIAETQSIHAKRIIKKQECSCPFC